MLNIQYIYRNIDKSEAFNFHAEEHLKEICYGHLGIDHIRLEIEREGHLFRVAICALTHDGEIMTSKKDENVYVAFDKALNAFKVIQNKKKESYANRRRERHMHKQEIREETLGFDEDIE